MTKNEITERLLQIVDELDNRNYDSIYEVDNLVAGRYEDLMMTAITEGWDVSSWDIVKLTHDVETANKIYGAFDDEIYDLYEKLQRIAENALHF